MEWIREELEKIRRENLYRVRRMRGSLKDFCSNDYLGLKDHPSVVEKAIEVLKGYGLGSGASQLVSGYTEVHRDLEERIAKFKGAPACVLFGSGYLANVGTIPVLAGEGDLILSDRLNHASLIDGCRFSKAEVRVFEHRDYSHLREILLREREKYRRSLIVTDGVFSMDGDMADVKTLRDLAEEFECILYVDDAHGTGTVGGGRGVSHEFGVGWEENMVFMGTLSKAIGSYGAFVCGSEDLIDLLVNRARSLIFTTSLPPSVCAGAIASIDLIEQNPSMVEDLKKKTVGIYKSLKDLPWEVRFHGTPIIPIVVGDEGEALGVSEDLIKRGVFLQAIRYPTVPRGRARLRLTVSLSYKDEDVDALIESLRELSSRHGKLSP